jgi:hypothetical protein
MSTIRHSPFDRSKQKGVLHRRQFLQTAGSLPALAALGVSAGPASGEGTASAQKPIYLSDLSRCQPVSALSRKPKRHHWRAGL